MHAKYFSSMLLNKVSAIVQRMKKKKNNIISHESAIARQRQALECVGACMCDGFCLCFKIEGGGWSSLRIYILMHSRSGVSGGRHE